MSNLIHEVQILHIPLTSIDLTDTRYRISREEDDISGLALSIKEKGLASPPIVRPTGGTEDCYIVVSGFKRLNALVSNGYEGKVVCLTYPTDSEKDSAVRAVSDNAFQRALTPAEQVRSILILTQFMDTSFIAKNSLGIFNTRLNEKFIKDLKTIGNLPQQALELMDDGRLSIKSARKISGVTPEVANCFVNLFTVIKASSSKQMEIIAHLFEIAARENLFLLDLFQDEKIQEILVHDSKDLGFKGNLLRNYLMERRFPAIEKKRQEVQNKLNSLKLGPGIKLTLPDNFESMTYSLSFEFKSLEDFSDRVRTIERVSTDPGLEEILKR